MRRYLENKRQLERGFDSYAHTRAGRHLKLAALIAAGVCVALMLAQVFFLACLPARALLLLRGCTGLCAIVFVILVAIFTFRANSSAIRGKS